VKVRIPDPLRSYTGQRKTVEATGETVGAVLVDTRPVAQRERDGEIPGALIVDRNVLEWRLDPTSAHRVTEVHDNDERIIVVCNEGFASSLAAATLQQLGLRNATDMIGGFQAWRASGLPFRARTSSC